MVAELGHPSAEAFLTDYLDLGLDLVGRVVGWLEQEQPAEAVTFQAAVEAAAARPLAKHGTNQHGEDVRTEPPVSRGETQAYLLRRIARD
jgi:hypothetical protein